MFSFRRAGNLIAATTATAVVLTGAPAAFAAEADQVTFNIANITDFHGRLEANLSKNRETGEVTPKAGDEMGAANVAGIINYLREQNPNTLVTTSGDNQGGSAFVSAISDDKYTMEFLQAIKVNGTAIGNHEFDKGYADLMNRIVPGTEVDGTITQLGANVFKTDGTRETKPYEIVDVDGVKVALVGTTSNLTVSKSNPANVKDLNITDSAEQVNVEAEKLKKDGKADLVIALIHDPAHTSAAKLNEQYVDFVFGGDDHIKRLDLEAPVPFAQSQEYGKVVTNLVLTYDKAEKKIVKKDAQQYDASHLNELGIEPDAAVADIVAKAKEQADVLGNQVVATIDADFKRGSNPAAAPGSNRGTESTANNMIAQSAVAALSEFLAQDIDFGIMNAGGVREDLAQGDVTYKQAFDVQPFGNNIAVATVSGAAIKEMLENQWQSEEAAAKSGRPRLDLGLSDNVAYTYNPEAPRGEKITSITINGKEVDPNKDYTVAGSTFLFDGGDGFLGAENFRDRNDVGYNDLQAFVDYLESGDATVRSGQKDVGVVLPEGGLKAGQKNEIKLTSLSYSSEGEPKAENVTVKIGGAEATAKVDNTVTDADKGYGEQGRATVTIDIPAGVSGEQTLTITTDKETSITMPVTVAKSDSAAPSQTSGSSDANLGAIIAAVVGVLSVLTLIFAFPIDQLLGPIAYLGR
ncbi:5'-nucleotidase C-terminal domain-containing protein [Corynebacterium sp. Q4381]|uniref:5'-nucleotidase C-terminal domain-containing protein n=1 Tax=Corynebacterium sp. Marseille-Q4381 TaxID=3121597 RepID=UPI002FE5CCD2